MNLASPQNMLGGRQALRGRLHESASVFKAPSPLDLVDWADSRRHVASRTSATPGKWRTAAQPVGYGPMRAVTERDTHTVTVMAGTQIVKTEICINTAGYFIDHDASPILFVLPTQAAAESFSKERMAPTIEATPALRERIAAAKARVSENTITHKSYPGGSIDFVGANSPTDLSSRPKRIIILDEIDKYPASAGAEGDPVKLAEERASTYHDVGRAKFLRTCSPTEEETSRIAREYAASDQRKCFVACPHCGFEQVLTWANVKWDQDSKELHLPLTATMLCQNLDCGARWTETERRSALDALLDAPDKGWRQTKAFSCCEEIQAPQIWDDRGRAHCRHCGVAADYAGHAGFHIPKLYSRRHRLSTLVAEFLEARHDAELLKKFTNTALAETWKASGREALGNAGLISRVEAYGPEDLPQRVLVVTGFADVQGDRLEVQLIGWGADEEAWPFLYEVIPQDPAQPAAWRELDALLLRKFRTRDGRILRVAAFGIDTGGHHGAQVYDFCRPRRGRRVFACKGDDGKRPIWPTNASRSKSNDPVWIVGIDTAKDAISARLKIEKPEGDVPRPGFVHFPADPGFGPDYFAQLTSEARITRKRMGRPYTIWWLPPGKRNEALDTFVGALAVRRSLPRWIERGLEFGSLGNGAGAAADQEAPTSGAPTPAAPPSAKPADVPPPRDERPRHHAFIQAHVAQSLGWMQRRGF